MKVSLRQEGIRGLYKGFPAYFLATAVWMYSVPSLTNWYMMNSPWGDRDQRDITFKGESSPMSKYEEEADDFIDEDLRAAMSDKS